jgi:hypothetical protein
MRSMVGVAVSAFPPLDDAAFPSLVTTRHQTYTAEEDPPMVVIYRRFACRKPQSSSRNELVPGGVEVTLYLL